MLPDLPDDILHMIVIELGHDHDFGTLFNCAASCRRLAAPAVAALYSMCELAPVTSRRNDEAARASSAETVGKWAKLWQSLILSTIGQTMYSYCHYSRALDLRDLNYLFDDPQFNGRLMRSFFGGMKSIVNDGAAVKKRRQQQTVIQDIGNVLVQKSPLVEELIGSLDADVDRAWVPQLHKLRRLQLWHGNVLEGLGQIIQAECPNFNACGFYRWSDKGDDADEPLSIFLSDLKPQSLRSLQFIGKAQIGALTLVALSESHGTSLTELILTDMPSEAISELGLLKNCIALRSLAMSESSRSTDLKATHPGVFEEVVEWLQRCKHLTRIKFTDFLSGASILTPLFVGNDLQLEELELSRYTQESGPAFYDSLRSQAETLRELLLQSETEEDPLRVSSIVSGVSRLRRLKVLHIKTISDFFQDEHFIVIAAALRSLEELWLSGWGVTDEIFSAFSGLHSLRRADIYAVSQFTFDGLMSYVSSLGEGNQDMLLGVSMANPQFALSEDEQAMIRQTIQERVNGRFDYNTSRGCVDQRASSRD